MVWECFIFGEVGFDVGYGCVVLAWIFVWGIMGSRELLVDAVWSGKAAEGLLRGRRGER
jgi:hypothetical protein